MIILLIFSSLFMILMLKSLVKFLIICRSSYFNISIALQRTFVGGTLRPLDTSNVRADEAGLM